MGGVRVKGAALLCLAAMGFLFMTMVEAQRGGLVSVPTGMRFNFYRRSCPRAEQIIRREVQKGFRADRTLPAGIIRMFFHDCFVRGCDASILLDNPDSEKLGAPNANSLRGFEVLDAAKAALERACPGTVSCADVLAYATRDAMELAGNLRVRTWLGGRRDGSVSSSAETLTELPAPFSNFTVLATAFDKKGLNQSDMIILSGSHTIGTARCGIILGRIYNFRGTGQADPTLNPSYVRRLRRLCPQNAPGNRIDMEMLTPTVLDSNYFRDVTAGRGLFESDNALRTTNVGRLLVRAYSRSRIFSPAFVFSMYKMGNIGVLTGTQGAVRTVCNVA